MNKRRKRTNKNVPAKGRLRDIADALWSRAIRDDWNNKCAVCGSGKCEAHHLLPRQHERTRYDMRNGIALCSQHHKYDPDISPHQNAAGWMWWFSKHCSQRCLWLMNMVDTGEYRRFTGTKNAQHYIKQILSLREYVDPSDFERIVGVRFTAYLLQQGELE